MWTAIILYSLTKLSEDNFSLANTDTNYSSRLPLGKITRVLMPIKAHRENDTERKYKVTLAQKPLPKHTGKLAIVVTRIRGRWLQRAQSGMTEDASRRQVNDVTAHWPQTKRVSSPHPVTSTPGWKLRWYARESQIRGDKTYVFRHGRKHPEINGLCRETERDTRIRIFICFVMAVLLPKRRRHQWSGKCRSCSRLEDRGQQVGWAFFCSDVLESFSVSLKNKSFKGSEGSRPCEESFNHRKSWLIMFLINYFLS